MLVSIIIPAFNAETTLRECLAACLRQTHPETEVIVVDDGSTDGTGHLCGEFPVRYFRQENAGPAAARNRGVREATGVFVAFTDSDCIPHEDWVERLLSPFREGVAAVGGTYGIANTGSLLARMVHEEIQARHETYPEEVDFLGSFNVAVRTEWLQRVGGFDESFPRASAEDNDLAYRLQDAGGMLLFARDAVVDHHHPTRLWPYLRTQLRHGYWRMKLYAKHPARARKGDRYAGPADLFAPPLALLLLGMIALTLLTWPWHVLGRGWNLLLAVMTLSYILCHVSVPARMVRRTGDLRMLWFIAVTTLRDVARALGMVAGMWNFMIRRGR